MCEHDMGDDAMNRDDAAADATGGAGAGGDGVSSGAGSSDHRRGDAGAGRRGPRRVRFDRSPLSALRHHLAYYGAQPIERRPRSSDPFAARDSSHLMTLGGYADLRDGWENPTEEDVRVGPGRGFAIPATPIVEWSDDGGQLVALPFEGIPLPGRIAARHILAVGSTGSGKTYRFGYGVLASLLRDTESSIFFNNVKGRVTTRELAAIARMLDPSIRVVVFAPGDVTRSVAINPVAIARRHDMVEQLAHQLAGIVREGRGGTNFWSASAARKFKQLLRHPEVDSIARLFALCSDPKALLAFAREKGDAQLEGMVSFITSGANGATSDANDLACLESFVSGDAVRAITSGPDEFDVVRLANGEQRFLFILEADDSTHAMLAPVIASVLQLVFDGLASAGRDDRSRRFRHVAFVLDELGAAPIRGLARKISIGRTHGYTVFGMVQSIAQIEARYGEDAEELLAGFNSKLWFLSGLSRSDRAAATREFGAMVVDEVTRRELRDGDGSWTTEARDVRQGERPLFATHEFRMRPHPDDIFGGFALLELVDCAPMLCHITPSWRDPHVSEAMRRGAADADPLRATPLPVSGGSVGSKAASSVPTDLRVAIDCLRELSDLDMSPEEREVVIGARRVSPETLEQMIASVRPVIAWPAPPRLACDRPPWIHRYEATQSRVAVYSLMSSLKLRKKTAIDLMRALAKARSEDPVVGLAQLDLDTLSESGPGGAGTSAEASASAARPKARFWKPG